MKNNTIKALTKIMLTALLAASAVSAAMAADINPFATGAITLLSGATINYGTASNYNAVAYLGTGALGAPKDVFISVTYNTSTNYASSAAYAALTNITAVFQRGDGLGNWETPVPVSAAYTLTIPGNQNGTNFVGFTNLTTYALPALRLAYITNQCGVDANCKVTNVTVRVFPR